MQYGGGTMFDPGSYDRYVPFKNYPEASFICLVWPMGLVQVSCNPFKEKELKDVHLHISFHPAPRLRPLQFHRYMVFFVNP